ncbi:DUF4124 domain-containing protein [Hydrogenophaga sp.]|uniref:DUF4124 domain-containing protein n=1 Tax=Hydrogenophaga sp. TaxID=1904254 RepID=UPI0019863AAD|nr:DUF4124 domain-containing protein [Hydrogenophaga sp.]MBD3892932.1 glutaredoxin family protein [Hydrogenophaga sp.]
MRINSSAAKNFHPGGRRRLVWALLLGVLAAPALAQGVHRIVGPDGRVTFTDRPPTHEAAARPVDPAAPGAPAQAAEPALPFVLRQLVSRFPVTLHSSDDCAPCDSARSLLQARGIPYREKTVNTAQDGMALRRLSGSDALPLLTVGSQQIKGFSEPDWTQLLDRAGYPARSILPANYRQPAPTALVDIPAPDAAAAAARQTDQPAAAAAPALAPPTGIRF